MTERAGGKAARMEETARLLKQGAPTEDIASELGVSVSTIRKYVAELEGRITKAAPVTKKPTSETRRWFESIEEEIARDYSDAQSAHAVDIQRSGHEGESTWADLLAKWLPPAYGVGLRKYIIGKDDRVQPFETDIVVFEPGYPQHLRYRAKVHVGGVAAAFSVKLTARKKHYKEIADWAAALANLTNVDKTTVEGQLLPGIPTGFLAHSHDLGEDPVPALAEGFDRRAELAAHPRDLVDLVCVADAGTLTCKRVSYIPMSGFQPAAEDFTMSSYLTMNDSLQYGAVAHFVVALYTALGRRDPSLNKLAAELARATGTGEGQGTIRKWDP